MSVAGRCVLALVIVVVGVDLLPPLLFYLRELAEFAVRAVAT